MLLPNNGFDLFSVFSADKTHMSLTLNHYCELKAIG